MMLPARGYMFIGLNVVRFLSVVALLLVFASNLVGMVHDIQAVNRFVTDRSSNASPDGFNATIASTMDQDYIYDSTVPNQAAGPFWAVLNRLLIMGQTIVLLLSEFGFPTRFFQKFFPILGKDFGLGPLGLIQCLIGAAILSHHVDHFSLVSAFFLFSIGCLNILIGLIWRESGRAKRSVTSWRETTKDVLPKVRDLRPTMISSPPPPSFHSLSKSVDEKDSYDSEASVNRVGYGFGRQGEKAAANRGYLITRPVEALPRYVPKATSNPFAARRSNPFSPNHQQG
jgi:hypothetical protein